MFLKKKKKKAKKKIEEEMRIRFWSNAKSSSAYCVLGFSMIPSSSHEISLNIRR